MTGKRKVKGSVIWCSGFYSFIVSIRYGQSAINVAWLINYWKRLAIC